MIKSIVILIILNISLILGQTVSGTVTDENGNGLGGANVTVDGTNMGAAADANGSYAINGVSPGSYSVTASFIGYSSSSNSVTVGDNGATANFALAIDALAASDVFVTGTRTAGRTAMKSPSPIDGFNEQDLRRQGNGDMTETLRNQVPSYNATPLTGDGSAFVRSTSMRGLPSDNVLVLTNSKRRHRSALIAHFGAAMNVGAHAADIGMIPSIAVKRLEVLRDGAAAQYGSDAIAGVMNFILKDNSEGVEFQVTQGNWMTAENGRGGERDITAAMNWGLPLSDNGFLNISAEYSVRPELSRGFQHGDASDGYKGWDATGITKDDEWKYVKSSPTDNTDEWQTAMNWGRPENNGFRSVWNAGLEIADGVNAYSFGNYADTYGEYSFFLRGAGKSGALTTVPLDPNDPTGGDFSWGDTYPLGFTPRLEGHGNDFSSVLGVEGDDLFGLGYDFSSSYGSNYLHYYLRNSLNLSWGPNSPHNFEIGDLQQEETNFNADFTYPMGDLSLAFGTEWREEKYTMYVGQKEAWMAGPWALVHTLTYDSAGTDVNYGYTTPGLAANGMKGTSSNEAGEFARTNTAYYVDTEYDMGDLLVQAAFRIEDYSDGNTTSDFKVAGRYSIGNLATLRGGYSTGFRAPTPGQSNYTGVTTSFDGVTGMQVLEGTVRPTDPVAASMGGAALVPEDATNISAGFTTSMLSGLNLSFDYYQVDIANKIIKSRALTVPEGVVTEYTELAFYSNALDTKTSGFDLVADYTMGSTNVRLALNHNETEVTGQYQVPGKTEAGLDTLLNPVSDGTVNNLELNLPQDKMVLNVTHTFSDALSAMVRINYYGESWDERGTYSEDEAVNTKDKIEAAMFMDVEIDYRISDNLSLVIGANNALNQFPTQIDTRAGQGMPYPRRSPLGYHGGMMFTRLTYNF
jgi:iron complex outermembrane receptor protein